jgi:hypothetical protein
MRKRRLLALCSSAALLSALMLTTGVGTALADTYNSPAHVTTTGDNTLAWTGQGTTDGELNSVQCGGDTPNPGDLLWIFTTDGYTLGSPDPVLTVNGTDYTGSNFGGSWHFVTSGESPDPAVTDASVDFNVTSLGGGQMVLTISHGCPAEEAAISDIVTEVHDAAHHDITGDEVDLGSTVHDSATLTWDPSSASVPTGSTITFYFYSGVPDTLEGPCTADPAAADHFQQFVLDGTEATPYDIDNALSQGPLGAGDYYYFAQFLSADTDVMTNATSGCEPFHVNKGDTETVTSVVREDTGADVPLGGEIPIGTSVHDTATVGPKVDDISLAATDGLTYYFYENGTCSGEPAWSQTVDVDANGVAADSSSTGPLGPGHYSFNAEYWGNDNYNPSGLSGCEPFAVFNAPLTPGYWKTHLAPTGSAGCTGLPNGTGCSNSGPWTSQYLTQTLGTYNVDTILKAAQVFAVMNCSNTGSNTTKNQNAIGCLAGHLLAAKLNVANGSNPCISSTIASADLFLTSIPYVGPSGNYSGISAAQRATAISLKSTLDGYNNGGGCP